QRIDVALGRARQRHVQHVRRQRAVVEQRVDLFLVSRGLRGEENDADDQSPAHQRRTLPSTITAVTYTAPLARTTPIPPTSTAGSRAVAPRSGGGSLVIVTITRTRSRSTPAAAAARAMSGSALPSIARPAE